MCLLDIKSNLKIFQMFFFIDYEVLDKGNGFTGVLVLIF